MEWIKGVPKEDGTYLTVQYYPLLKTFGIPKVLNFKWMRYRNDNKLSVDDKGNKRGCWVNMYGSGSEADYFMPIPDNPTHLTKK